MATALIVTFTAYNRDHTGDDSIAGVTSQTLTFVDVGPAQKALAAIQEQYNGLVRRDAYVVVDGTILKDVVI